MSLRPLASLAVKMLGLYAVVNSLPTISMTLFSLLSTPPVGPPSTVPGWSLSPVALALLNASSGALQALVGIALWWFSDSVAQSAVPDDGDVPVRKDATLTAIGFSIVGAYLLADFATRISGYLASVYVVSVPNSPLRPENVNIGARDLIPILVRGAIALYLLLGSHGWIQALALFKNIGRERETAALDTD